MDSISALKAFLKDSFKGEWEDSSATITKYSRDAGLFEVTPRIVLFPKDAEDIKAVVHFVRVNKATYPDLSITARAAGTDMSGGPINDSIILDIARNMHGVISMTKDRATVLPGTYYRDFEKESLKQGVILPCYTASKNLNTVGGMVANNSAGEKTLKYGQTKDYVESLKVVFADGNEYEVKALDKEGLKAKLEQQDFEGQLYRDVWDIVSRNEALLANAKPKVSKNAAGYYLWNVWDPTADGGKGRFDMAQLVVGSQGTLGIVTEATIRLVPVKPLSKLFVIFMPTIDRLGDVVNDLLPFKPESLESYDDSTMALAVKFLPSMVKSLGLVHFLHLAWKFIPEAWMAIRGGFPKLVLLVEFSGDNLAEIDAQIDAAEAKVKGYGFKMRRAADEFDSEKYWTIRRESFNLLRRHVTGRRTAPFVDDVVVPPHAMPDFLPKMRAILDEYKLMYTIAGHAGNGNFHIIPLMDMADPASFALNRKAIDEVSDKVYELVLSYGGSITGEHNDGIVRTPYLPKMFSPEIMTLFKQAKDAFDPTNIFNPGKKIGATKEFMLKHLSRS
ncbi:MAG: FAD-binding oxidoreductase [bacterium]|nr:FAD-binding oxidoreductase [bacterium]